MLNTAAKAARKAGSIINRASLDVDLVKVASEGRSDVVTEVDRAAENSKPLWGEVNPWRAIGVFGDRTGQNVK